MKYKIYSNGREITDTQQEIFPGEEACGIFESMRAYGGVISGEAEHLQRLFESAKTVGYDPMPTLQKLRRELTLALRASGEKDTSVRLTLGGGKIFVMIGLRETAPTLYRSGVVLKTASFPRGDPRALPHQAKAAAYQQAILASTEPHTPEIFDWLFVDPVHGLTETRVGNFFLIKYLTQGEPSSVRALLQTPPEHLILNGVTRRFVIKCARESGFRVHETPLTRHDFFNADEAFLSNTSWEILPVRELDGRTVGLGNPGPLTLKLHHEFQRRILNDAASNHSTSPD